MIKQSMMWNPRIKRMVWLLLPLTLLLAGCGDDEPPPTPTPTQTVAAATATATPQVESVVEPTATPVPAAGASPLTTASGTLTTGAAITASAPALTAAEASTLSVMARSAGCTMQPDLDLASYQDVTGTLGCPQEPASFDPVGINEFGPGPEIDRFMLWLSNEKQIYVLLPDGTWQVYPDTWTEDQPTFSCNPLGGAEESPPLPRRGFSKIWCSVEGLADVMGPVPREERLCQHAVLQRFENGRLLACYEDATIRYIRLLDGNTWDTVLTR